MTTYNAKVIYGYSMIHTYTKKYITKKILFSTKRLTSKRHHLYLYSQLTLCSYADATIGQQYPRIL